MSTHEWAPGMRALVEAEVDGVADDAAYIFAKARDGGYIGGVISTDALIPLPGDDVIDSAARVIAQLEPGEDWPTNEALGGSLTGTRDDEFRDACLGQARELASAGLLAARPERVVKAEAWDKVARLLDLYGLADGGVADFVREKNPYRVSGESA